jgi:anti-anti-sigma regulatory factor
MTAATDELLLEKESAELRTEARAGENMLTLTLKGTADSRVAAELGEILTTIHAEATKRKSHEVIVDFRALDFMNSSCFKAFVTWIAKVQDLAADAQYRIRFTSDSNKHWQRRSLSALSCFAVDLIRVDS